MSFMPEGYEVPNNNAGGKYLNPSKIENSVKIRILGSFTDDTAIMGHEYWKTTDDGRKPVRKRMGEKINVADIEEDGDLKHFWALPVYNHDVGTVQVMAITQKSIMTAIKDLANDEDWGDPRQYDIKLIKTGEKLETRYSVQPVPARELSSDAKKVIQDTKINIQALFDGADPFEASDSSKDTSDDI